MGRREDRDGRRASRKEFLIKSKLPAASCTVVPRTKAPRVEATTCRPQLERRKAAKGVAATTVARGRSTLPRPLADSVPRKRRRSPSPTRNARAKFRRAAAHDRGDEISTNYLRKRGVREGTAVKYAEFIVELEEFAVDNGLTLRPLKKVDAVVAHWMANAFAEGEQPFRGAYMVAAVGWEWPELGKFGSTTLPHARQTLAGWRRLAPASSKLPLPPAVVSGIANTIAAQDGWRMAVEVVLMKIFYLRPGEAKRLTGRSLVRPKGGSGLGRRVWSIVLHESEKGVSSKTREFDETLLLDLDRDRWFEETLGLLKNDTGDDEYLFQEEPKLLARALARAGAHFGLTVVPYMLRHTGASCDFADGSRTIEQIKHRGRWQSDASVRRYEKGGRSPQTWSNLGVDVRDYCERSHRHLPAILGGRRTPSVLP